MGRAVALWREGVNPRGTLVETYLASRALSLPPEIACDVIRFHAACPWRDNSTNNIVRVPAMLAVMRNIRTNKITAIQRTALTPDGRKIERRMLGIAGGSAIKLDEDVVVALRLTVAEGFETALAARQLHYKPVWALGSVAAVASFPALDGIESLTLLEETGDNGASSRAVEECGSRWHRMGREVIVITPRGCTGDLNDVVMKWNRGGIPCLKSGPSSPATPRTRASRLWLKSRSRSRIGSLAICPRPIGSWANGSRRRAAFCLMHRLESARQISRLH
jgi:putative DNA primase/helicase